MYKEYILDQMKPKDPICPYCRVKLKVDKKKGIGRCSHCGFTAKKGYW